MLKEDDGSPCGEIDQHIYHLTTCYEQEYSIWGRLIKGKQHLMLVNLRKLYPESRRLPGQYRSLPTTAGGAPEDESCFFPPNHDICPVNNPSTCRTCNFAPLWHHWFLQIQLRPQAGCTCAPCGDLYYWAWSTEYGVEAGRVRLVYL